MLVDIDAASYEYISPAYEKIVGIPAKQTLSTPPADLLFIHENDRSGVLAELKDLATVNQKRVNHHCRVLNGDESYVEMLLNAFRVSDDDAEPAILVCQLTPASDNEVDKVQVNRLNIFNKLIPGFCHDINNPNNLIMLNTSFCNEIWQEAIGVLDDYHADNPEFYLKNLPYSSAREKFKTILERTLGSSTRITQILDLFKAFVIQDVAEENSQFDLNKVLKDSISVINYYLKTHTSNFEVQYLPQAMIVSGYRQQLEQVIINLLIIACQNMTSDDRGVQVKTAAQGNCYLLEIHYNHDNQPTDNTKNSGLDLSVVRHLLQKHNGKLVIDRLTDNETAMTMSIPVSANC